MGFDVFTMPSTATFLLLSTCAIGLTPVQALPWPGPQLTAVYKADEWSPRPTSVSSPADLFKRDSIGVEVCGWYGGLQASPAACGVGSSCIRDTVHGNVGCCATEGPCTAGVYTSCVDQNSAGWEPNSGIQANGVFTCGPSFVCNRNEYQNGYYQYSCGTSSSAAAVATTYAGQPTDLFLQVVFTAVNYNILITQSSTRTSSLTSSSSASSTPTTTSASTTPTTTSTTSTPTTTSATSTADNKSQLTSSPTSAAAPASLNSKSNTAAIAGGVVGGIAGLAAIAAAALFCFRRRRKADYDAYIASKVISPDGSPRSTFRQVAPITPNDFTPPRETRQSDVPEILAEPPTAASRALGYPPPYGSERPIDEMEPFVSEIDEFSRSWTGVFSNQESRRSTSSWHDTIFGAGDEQETAAGEAERNTHIHAGYVPTPMRRNSSVYSSASTRFNFGGSRNTRTANLNISSESIRSESASIVISPMSLTTPAALYNVSLEDDNEDFLNRTLSTRGRVLSDNVKGEGWSPSRLNIPPKPSQAAAQDGRKRYSLADNSSEGRVLPVLVSKGSRPQKDRASIGSSRGGFRYGSVRVMSG